MKHVLINKVYEMRNQRNMTQEELADAVGVTRQTIIAIEKGNYAPSVFLALKCSSVLREPVEKIFKITK